MVLDGSYMYLNDYKYQNRSSKSSQSDPMMTNMVEKNESGDRKTLKFYTNDYVTMLHGILKCNTINILLHM